MRSEKLLCGLPQDKLVKVLKESSESSPFAEVKAIHLALEIAGREKWPALYLYTDSWVAADALWGLLQQYKQASCSTEVQLSVLLHCGKTSLPGKKTLL